METQTSSTLLLKFFWGYISAISVYNLPRLHTTNVDRSNKRKWLYTKKKKARSRRYLIKTITGADYVDEVAILANTPT